MLATFIRRATGAGCAAALVLAATGTGSAAAASTLVPNRFDDPAPPAGTSCTPPAPPDGCSLRGAIDAAQAGDTVKLGAGTYTLSLDSLDVPQSITITGAGPQSTTVQQTGTGRVFEQSGVSVPWALQGVTVTGGNIVGTKGTNGSGAGGGGGLGSGIGGGGIATDSPLSLTDVVVTGNKATGGNGGNGAPGNASHVGGEGGFGGSAEGGGIEAFADLTLVRVAVTNNAAHAGDGGHGAKGGSTTAGGAGGTGGQADGGGIEMGVGNTLTATDSLISGNTATGGAGGDGGVGGTSKGAGGAGGIGGSGSGGGIDSLGPVNLTNMTISGNFAVGQPGGAGGNARGTNAPSKGGAGGSGGSGFGGALALVNVAGGPGHLASVTVDDNGLAAGAGIGGAMGSDGGANGSSGPPGSAFGGNVSLINASLELLDTVVADGHAGQGQENCSLIAGATITSLGHNLEDHHQCIGTAATGDRLDTPAALGPLAANGGPTETMAPDSTSAVIRGGEVGCLDALGQPLADDQRGLPRPLVCDIGAFQGQAPTVGAVAVNGTVKSGSLVACTGGTLTGDQPLTSAFSWLRDDAAVGGASGTTLAVTSADVGHTLACRETASNPWGTAGATSASVTVAPPRLTSLKLSPRKVRSGHKETVSFRLDATAQVTFSLTRVRSGTKVGKRCVARTGKHKHGHKCTRLTSAHGAPSAVSVSAGNGTVSWKPHGLKNGGKYRLTATPADGTGSSVTFTVSKPKPKPRHKRHGK
jgi:hypothetical protein